jgi:hypothetical protein
MRVADPVEDWPRWLLDGYEPHKPWHDDPMTEPHRAALERRGWTPPDDLTKGGAAYALNRPSRKQRDFLAGRGLWGDEDGMTYADARDVIGGIALHEGWGR